MRRFLRRPAKIPQPHTPRDPAHCAGWTGLRLTS